VTAAARGGSATAAAAAGSAAIIGSGHSASDLKSADGSMTGGKPERHMPGDGYMLLSHADAAASSSRAGRIGVYQVPAGRYCARVKTVQAYGDVRPGGE